MKKRNFFTLKVFSIPVLLLSLLLLFSLQGAAQVTPQVGAGVEHTVGLKCDGTAVAVGWNYDGQCNVEGWTDIVQVSVGGYHTVGLKSDGTVVAVGYNYYGQCIVGSWTDIIQVSPGWFHTVGLKSDGTAVAVGRNDSGQCNVGSWTDIIQVSPGGGYHTAGLKSDGTVVAVGKNDRGQCDVGSWTDITQISAGGWHTVGLKSDGTVVAIGKNYNGQCNVGSWFLPPCVIIVDIDIKPGSDPNSINLGSHGLLPVAILGSEDFDVSKIYPETVEIGEITLAERGSAKNPKLAYSYGDVNSDGYLDMMTFFEIKLLVSEGILTENTTELVINASLDNGFSIKGTDSVHVVNY